MAQYRLSNRAVQDLIEINRYTLEAWGELQADSYERQLRACCVRLAASPYLGRRCEEYGFGMRRIEQGRHVIFYRMNGDGILVSRILHVRMRPTEGRLLT